MKQRLELSITYFFVLGSGAISTMDFISQPAKSVFLGTAMAVLISMGIMYIYKYFQKASESK